MRSRPNAGTGYPTRRRKLLIGLGAVFLLVAAFVKLTSPPALLSYLDFAFGGGRDVEKIGSGIAFGTHGQMLDVWKPKHASKRPLPVLIFWYGGGWVHGSRGAYAFAARAFASKGFLVIVPDYRKVPTVHFPAFLVDGAQAVRWTKDNVAKFGGDAERITVAGHSAGAYTVAMLTLDKRWLQAEDLDPGIVKAAVALCGPYDFYPFTKKRSIEAMKGVANPQDTQPINFVRRDAAPLLLVSAGEDTQIGAHNAKNLAARQRTVGGQVEHIVYPGLSHENVAMALSVPFRSKAPVLDNAVSFLSSATSRDDGGLDASRPPSRLNQKR